LKQENLEFQASLSYITDQSQKNKAKKQQQQKKTFVNWRSGLSGGVPALQE
jgi:hypothetical protein